MEKIEQLDIRALALDVVKNKQPVCSKHLEQMERATDSVQAEDPIPGMTILSSLGEDAADEIGNCPDCCLRTQLGFVFMQHPDFPNSDPEAAADFIVENRERFIEEMVRLGLMESTASN